MYSTNLTVGNKWMAASLYDEQNNCIGTAYGWETPKDVDSEASQTAKDNALLWSLAPEMVELLREGYEIGTFGQVKRIVWRQAVEDLLAKLPGAVVIPPASVAQNG